MYIEECVNDRESFNLLMRSVFDEFRVAMNKKNDKIWFNSDDFSFTPTLSSDLIDLPDGTHAVEVLCLHAKNKTHNATEIDYNRGLLKIYVTDFEVFPNITIDQKISFSEEELKQINYFYVKNMLLKNFDNMEEYKKNFIRYQLFKNQKYLKTLSTEMRIEETKKIKIQTDKVLAKMTTEILGDVLFSSYFVANNKNNEESPIKRRVMNSLIKKHFAFYLPKTRIRQEKITKMLDTHQLCEEAFYSVLTSNKRTKVSSVFETIDTKTNAFLPKDITRDQLLKTYYKDTKRTIKQEL